MYLIFSRITKLLDILIVTILLMTWLPTMTYGYNTAIQRSKLPFNVPHEIWVDMNGPCKETNFTETIPLDNCPSTKTFSFENKQCIGVCPNVYEPNLVKSNKHVANRCAMCKPDARTVTFLVKCNKSILKVPVRMVRGCECRYVNCECPLRKTS